MGVRPLKLIKTEIADSNQNSLQVQDINNFFQCIYGAHCSVLLTLPKSQLEVHTALENMEV